MFEAHDVNFRNYVGIVGPLGSVIVLSFVMKPSGSGDTQAVAIIDLQDYRGFSRTIRRGSNESGSRSAGVATPAGLFFFNSFSWPDVRGTLGIDPVVQETDRRARSEMCGRFGWGEGKIRRIDASVGAMRFKQMGVVYDGDMRNGRENGGYGRR